MKLLRVLLWITGIYIVGFVLIAIFAHIFPRPIPKGNYYGGYWGTIGFAWCLWGFLIIFIGYPIYVATHFLNRFVQDKNKQIGQRSFFSKKDIVISLIILIFAALYIYRIWVSNNEKPKSFVIYERISGKTTLVNK